MRTTNQKGSRNGCANTTKRPGAPGRLAIAVILLVCIYSSTFAQPRVSPEVRSRKEMKWLQDSVHIDAGQLRKIAPVSLRYQQEMDEAANSAARIKKQAKLMQQKDKSLKAILSKQQYRQYYKRECLDRKKDKVMYKAGRQPM